MKILVTKLYCNLCGQLFDSARTNHRFCSEKCGERYRLRYVDDRKEYYRKYYKNVASKDAVRMEKRREVARLHSANKIAKRSLLK